MHLLFVYGTLKRGYGNNQRLRNSRLLGAATAIGSYEMWDVGFPMVAKARRCRGGKKLAGELYLVDDATLESCDRLEGHPRFYQRRRASIEINGRRVNAWIYLQGLLARESYYPLMKPKNGTLNWGRSYVH